MRVVPILLVAVLGSVALAGESPFLPVDGKPEAIAALARGSARPVLLALLDDG